MFSNWLRNLKWALLIAIVAGPAFAYYSYTELQTIQMIDAEGIAAASVIDGATSEKHRRSARSYSVHAVWTDASGNEIAQDIPVTSEFAQTIIEGDFLTIDAADIKYLPTDSGIQAVVVADIPTQIADKQLMMWLGVGAGMLGLVGSALFFMAGRRSKAPAAA